MSSEAEQVPSPGNDPPAAERAADVRSGVTDFAIDEVGLDFLGNFAEASPIVGIPVILVVGAWRILSGQPEKSPWRAWLRRRRAKRDFAQTRSLDSSETPRSASAPHEHP